MSKLRLRPNLALYAAILLLIVTVAAGPILQAPNYHAFADTRVLFGLPNGADVLSNAGFLLAGLLGLSMTPRAGAARTLFCWALVLTAIGSTWYHLAPDNTRLVWDRLPIALACAALLAGELTQAQVGRSPVLTLLVLSLAALASVLWWKHTGDLRPYLLFQLAPLLLIPLLHWQTGAAPARKKAFALAIGLYVLAKLCELGDAAGFQVLGVVSGHTLKHLLAALAALVLVRYLAKT